MFIIRVVRGTERISKGYRERGEGGMEGQQGQHPLPDEAARMHPWLGNGMKGAAGGECCGGEGGGEGQGFMPPKCEGIGCRMGAPRLSTTLLRAGGDLPGPHRPRPARTPRSSSAAPATRKVWERTPSGGPLRGRSFKRSRNKIDPGSGCARMRKGKGEASAGQEAQGAFAGDPRGWTGRGGGEGQRESSGETCCS